VIAAHSVPSKASDRLVPSPRIDHYHRWRWQMIRPKIKSDLQNREDPSLQGPLNAAPRQQLSPIRKPKAHLGVPAVL